MNIDGLKLVFVREKEKDTDSSIEKQALGWYRHPRIQRHPQKRHCDQNVIVSRDISVRN